MDAASIAKLKETLIDFVVRYGFQAAGAVIILIAGLIVAKFVGKLVGEQLDKRKVDPPVRSLVVRGVRLVIMAITGVIALSKFGVDILPLIAGLGVIGVGVGLAMQGVLSNVVAGLTIIFTKPFRIGEYIEIVGVQGQVHEIELFSTTLIHSDFSRVIIPNRRIVGEILHNYGQIRQLALNVGVAYNSDLEKVREIVRRALDDNARVLKEPKPNIGIAMLDDSAVVVSVAPWVNVPDVGPAQGEIYQSIVERFRQAGVEIPLPQREVRMLAAGAK